MEDQTHPSGLYVRKGMPFGAPFLVDETELNESGKGNCRLQLVMGNFSVHHSEKNLRVSDLFRIAQEKVCV